MSALTASAAKGLHKVARQTHSILRKNLWVMFRNRRALVIQVFGPAFFMIFLKLTSIAIQSNQSDSDAFKRVTHQDEIGVGYLPRCIKGRDASYAATNGNCLSLAYAPNTTLVNSVVSRMKISAGIPDSELRAFDTEDQLKDFVLANPNVTQSAIVFYENYTSPTPETPDQRGLYYAVMANLSLTINQRIKRYNPFLYVVAPLVRSASEAILQEYTNESTLSFDVSRIAFPHPAFEAISVIGDIGPIFLFGAAMFAFVIQLGQIVGEKEFGLREAMVTMGLKNSVFWISWYIMSVVMGIITTGTLVGFGLLLDFPFFEKNAFGLYFFHFWLFSLAMSGFMLLCAVFVTKSRTATTLGFSIFMFSLILMIMVQTGFPFGTNTVTVNNMNAAPFIQSGFALIPSTLFAKGLNDLGQFSKTDESTGLSWSQRGGTPPSAVSGDSEGVYALQCDGNNDSKCDHWPLEVIYWWFLAESVGYAFLAWYLDLILPNENGVRRSPFFFLTPSFWGLSRKGKLTHASELSKHDHVRVSWPEIDRDNDVVAEESRVRNDDVGKETRVKVRNLVKSYQNRLFGVVPYGKPFHAVKGAWFHIEEGTVFALLGPNGAGKTTTLKMLSGVIPPSGGDAFVFDYSIRSDIDRVRKLMGVCPQFDVQWNELTGEEHVRLFCELKNPRLSDSEVRKEVRDRLEQVYLYEHKDKRAGSYSGGMRRRLSVAIALCSDPKIVYLDEPSTGMDPVSRRQVWEIIQNAKKGRVIVLTTHSMEEADTLGDNIAIMAKGHLRCIGSSLKLKNKFGTGYRISLHVKASADRGAIHSAVQRALPGAEAEGESVTSDAEFVNFIVPRSQAKKLPGFFRHLEQEKEKLGLLETQLTQTTLEEVFLNIAHEAERQDAAAEAGQPYEKRKSVIGYGASSDSFE